MKKIQTGCSLVVAAVLAFTLSARAEEKPSEVKLADLPAAVQQAVVQSAGGSTIQRIIKAPVMYEINFMQAGVNQNFLVNETATKTEGPRPVGEKGPGSAIQWTDLPEAVQKLLSAKFPGVTYVELRRRTVVYVATVQTAEGTALVRVEQDGKVLSHASANELAEKRQMEERALAERQAKERAENAAKASQ